jgi:DNA-binding FadR family transcriptional regulator
LKTTARRHERLEGLTGERAVRIDTTLRTRIENGTWPPGHTFSWPQLAEEFSLTNTEVTRILAPVLRGMRLDGLIESRRYVGVRVVVEGKPWSPPPGYSNLPHDEYIETILRKRLKDGLRKEGLYRPGEQFTPLADLAEEFGVSIATIRKAVKPLKQQGILVLVNTNRTHISPDLAQFTDEELLRPPARRKPGKTKLRAFGESRPLAEWARDPRCKVTHRVLFTRYVSGWDLETALTAPRSHSWKHPRKKHASRPDADAKPAASTDVRKNILFHISRGSYPPGTVIQPADIALRSGVDEKRVVDVLRELQESHIVDHRHGIGYFTTISSYTREPRSPQDRRKFPPFNEKQETA